MSRTGPRPTLLVVCPAAQRTVLRDGLTQAGWRVHCVTRPRARGGADRHGLAPLAARWRGRCEGILLVAPRQVPAASACPAAVLAGLPVASVHADHPAQLSRWLAALPRAGSGGTWAVLAPGQHHYLNLARGLRRRLVRSGRSVASWCADRLSREALRQRLAERPALVAYTGHGTPEGLPAFGGLSLTDWGAKDVASGAVALFSCQTLAWRGGRPGFAWRLAAEGRAASVLAAVDDVERTPHTAFVRRCVEHLAAGTGSLGEALVELDRELPARSPLRAILGTYRLVGLPVLRVHRPSPSGG